MPTGLHITVTNAKIRKFNFNGVVMKIISTCILFFSLLFSIHIVYAANVVQDGTFFLKEEQYQKAADFFKSELSKNPNDTKTNAFLGDAYYLMGRVDEAKAAYNTASTDLKAPYGYLGLGKIELNNGNRLVGLTLFDQAVKIDRKKPEVYAAIAMACLQMYIKPDTDTASAYLTKGTAMGSRNVMFQMVTGDLNVIQKNYDEAAKAYKAVILIDKSNYEAYRKLGVLYTTTSNTAEAKKNFEQSLRLAPNQILGYKLYSDLYYNLGKFADAKKYYVIYYSKVTPTAADRKRYAYILCYNKEQKEASALLKKERDSQTWYELVDKGLIQPE